MDQSLAPPTKARILLCSDDVFPEGWAVAACRIMHGDGGGSG